MRRAVPPRGLGGNMGQGTSPLWGAGVKPLALRSKYFRLWQSLGSPRGLNAPFRKRVHGDAFPLNQYHSPLGRGSKPLSCPLSGVVWVAPFRQGRSVRYHSRWSFLMLPHSLDFILAFWQSVTSIFPFTAFTKCALIYQLTLVCAPYGVFCKI